MRTKVSDIEVQSFVDWISSSDLQLNEKANEFQYDNVVLVLIDAVLSMNRQYQSFVVPRVTSFTEKYPHVRSLDALKQLIAKDHGSSFKEVWNYDHPERVRILEELVEFYLHYKHKSKFQTDKDAMRHWADTGMRLPVKGIAYKTTQYIRMMLGVSTVKPDIHVHRAVQDAIGKKLSDLDVVALVELAAEQIGQCARNLDYAIWKRYSNKE